MSEQYEVQNIAGYAWTIPGYVLLYLNVPKFVWMAFALHLTIVIPDLNEP